MIEITLLGTSSAFPTEERNHPSLYVKLDSYNILIDCGEGTQRQIRKAGLSPKIDYIFITHWHADHSLGIIGILSSAKLQNLSMPVIFGPKGTKQKIKSLLKIFNLEIEKLKIVEVDAPKEKEILKLGDYTFYALNLKHTVKCLGYKIKEKDKVKILKDFLEKNNIKSGPHLRPLLEGKDIIYEGKKIKHEEATRIEKGKIITYLTDFRYEDKVIKFAKDSDYLFIESTFMSDLEDKAKDYYHLSILDAMKIAENANAKKVILMHISQRYKEGEILEEIAKLKGNLDVELGKDFNKYLIRT